jgi:NAD(P)-dependent dehydrogenase (short-subunit alcohol dehydrogenase family)
MAATHNTTADDQVAFVSKITPAGRIGQPAEAANVAAFLLGDDASCVSRVVRILIALIVRPTATSRAGCGQ